MDICKRVIRLQYMFTVYLINFWRMVEYVL